MDKENFGSTRGRFQETGEGENVDAFLPPDLPVELNLDLELLKLLDDARGNLGRLYSMSEDLENPSLYYGSALIQEAVSSSRIEGTRTTMEKVFEKEIELEGKEINAESQELRDPEDAVTTLQQGIEYGLERIQAQPMNVELIKRLHQKVFSGSGIRAGDFRNKQVWIGPEAAGINQAQYVPPPQERIEPLLENLVNYVNKADSDLPVIVKIALAHYQFEAIHPFEDGNGRVGRLMILLQMCDEEIFEEEPLLTGPFINLSNYFLRNRQRYYDRLMQVSANGEYLEWVKFFLKGVKNQSRHAIKTLETVEDMRKEFKNSVDQEGVPKITSEVVDELFRNPIITIPKVQAKFDVSYHTANQSIHALEEEGILEEKKPGQRPKKFICKEILNVVYSDFNWSI